MVKRGTKQQKGLQTVVKRGTTIVKRGTTIFLEVKFYICCPAHFETVVKYSTNLQAGSEKMVKQGIKQQEGLQTGLKQGTKAFLKEKYYMWCPEHFETVVEYSTNSQEGLGDNGETRH